MYNLILLAARPPDWTHERFIDWWRGDHAELTRQLPGLRAWRHTDLDAALESRSEGWDGVSVLSFDTWSVGKFSLVASLSLMQLVIGVGVMYAVTAITRRRDAAL